MRGCRNTWIDWSSSFRGKWSVSIWWAWRAVGISAFSFVLWVYTMLGPLQSFGFGAPYVGSLMVLVWTFIIPYVYRGQ